MKKSKQRHTSCWSVTFVRIGYITVHLFAVRINKIIPRKAVEQRVHHVTNLLDVADAETRLFELRLQIQPALRARRSLYQRVQEPDACGLQVQTATCAA